MALAARTLGVRHPHPWQLSAWDVAGELVEVDGVLRHAYSTVVWSLPRRAGKTIGVLARVLALLAAEDQRGWYTAQSRQDAATQLRDEWLPMIQASPYGPHIRSRMTNGSEVIMSPSRRSSCRLFAPKPEALHGAAGDLIVYDEAWSQTRERGAELIAAARPLMATRPGAQLWIVSAAGDEQSTWWADWLTIGRDAAAADTGHGVAFVEYGADAPDLDLDDPAVWDRMHPAVRSAANPHGTITREWLEVERATIGTAQFARLYGNVTDRTGATGASPIDVEGWLQLGVDTLDRDGLLTLGVDVSPDQASTAIVAATHERATTLEVVDHRAGTGWAVERIVDLCDRYHVHAVALDSGAPAGSSTCRCAPPGSRSSTPSCATWRRRPRNSSRRSRRVPCSTSNTCRSTGPWSPPASGRPATGRGYGVAGHPMSTSRRWSPRRSPAGRTRPCSDRSPRFVESRPLCCPLPAVTARRGLPVRPIRIRQRSGAPGCGLEQPGVVFQSCCTDRSASASPSSAETSSSTRTDWNNPGVVFQSVGTVDRPVGGGASVRSPGRPAGTT
jgi:hypothetical protein